MTDVALVRAAGYDGALEAAVERALTLAPPPVVAGRTVLLKPALADVPQGDRPVVTHPAVVFFLAQALLRRRAARVLVGDGPALQRAAAPILEAAGYPAYLRSARLRFIDLNYVPVRRAALRGDGCFPELYVADTALTADVVVSVPKLKTHHWTGVSLSCKNMLGVTSGMVYGWPRNRLHVGGLSAAIASTLAACAPHYCLVDGVMAMEGDGPLRGDPAPLGALVAGCDPVAVDATCAQLMGLLPARIEHLRCCAARRGGWPPVTVCGEPPLAVQRRFVVLPHQANLRAN